jgi:serine/threonine protein kinase
MNTVLETRGYSYVRALAKGGTSKVFLIRDVVGGELLACKKIPTCQDKTMLLGSSNNRCILIQDVNREIGFMKRMVDVDGVCQYVDSFKEEDQMYLITKAYLGGDIEEYLDELDATNRENQVKHIIKNALEIIKRVHEKNVIHNDIKPENFALQNFGNIDTMNLLDFGSAVDAKNPELGHMFTPWYMPIEMLCQEVSKKSDAWQVGIMTYYLLSKGHFPFNDKSQPFNPSLYKIWYSIQHDDVDFDFGAWEGISEDGKEFILEMLCKKVKDRATVSEALTHPWFSDILCL